MLLQKQYRPPIDKVCIEVPAGLVDAGESAERAAVRELKEETGYVGVVSESSPVMFNGTYAPCCVSIPRPMQVDDTSGSLTLSLSLPLFLATSTLPI